MQNAYSTHRNPDEQARPYRNRFFLALAAAGAIGLGSMLGQPKAEIPYHSMILNDAHAVKEISQPDYGGEIKCENQKYGPLWTFEGFSQLNNRCYEDGENLDTKIQEAAEYVQGFVNWTDVDPNMIKAMITLEAGSYDPSLKEVQMRDPMQVYRDGCRYSLEPDNTHYRPQEIWDRVGFGVGNPETLTTSEAADISLITGAACLYIIKDLEYTRESDGTLIFTQRFLDDALERYNGGGFKRVTGESYEKTIIERYQKAEKRQQDFDITMQTP